MSRWRTSRATSRATARSRSGPRGWATRTGNQDGNLTALMHANAQRNVDDTLDALDQDYLEKVARCLSSAGTTVVVACGAAHGAGEDLASSLQIIEVRSSQVTGISEAAPVLATLGTEDAVVGLSLWRYLKSTVVVLEHAKRDVGASTVVLTDSAVSSAA